MQKKQKKTSSRRKGLFETCGRKTDRMVSRSYDYVKDNKTVAIAGTVGVITGILLTIAAKS